MVVMGKELIMGSNQINWLRIAALYLDVSRKERGLHKDFLSKQKSIATVTVQYHNQHFAAINHVLIYNSKLEHICMKENMKLC